jgi:hypothetical protein
MCKESFYFVGVPIILLVGKSVRKVSNTPLKVFENLESVPESSARPIVLQGASITGKCEPA